MATIKTAYAASVAATITLNALASDATNMLAGRSSAVIDNTSSNLYLDYLVGGTVESGTSPTAGTIEVWAWAILNDTPTYPDVITGSDANATITTRNILAGFGRLVASMPVTATTNVKYPFGPVSLASLFGGSCPEKFGFFVVHNTVAALASAGNVISVTPVYATAV